ncbi:MAG: Rid family hydrolase, partial [Planctomycetota bacterium]
MTANFEIRSVDSALATEIYISATPGQDASLQDQAREIFSGIRDILRSRESYILQERIFSTLAATDTIRQARSEAYGDLDDGVAPSFLVAAEGSSGPIAGVQVHAVSTENKPEVVNLNQTGSGRILRIPGCAILTLSGISAPQASNNTEQAQIMLEMGESVLKQFSADFLSVPRTWMWLKDILSWYDDFNSVRNNFFTERGLIGAGTRQSMPASTGIGLGPDNGGHCAMDLVAILEPADSTQYLQVTGKQHCALNYGSAFSRASKANTPAGQTVYVSGTASIDADGATTNIGDAAGQINATIENVRAVLTEMQSNEKDLVQVIAYCKTNEVEQVFNSIKGNLDWPWITVICDICRHDLL